MAPRQPTDLTTILETGTTTSGLNLGGIGCGGVEIWPDGRLREWSICNNQPWSNAHQGPDAIPELGIMDAEFFVRIAEDGKRPVYRWLFTGNGKALGTASHFWRHHKYFFIKSMRAVRYTARFPVAELTFVDPELPVAISMKAWSPSIPRDTKNSSLPGAFFDIQVDNQSGRKLEISLVWQMQNLAGYGAETATQAHRCFSKGRVQGVQMRGSLAEPDHPTSGDMSIWCNPEAGQQVTTVAANPYFQNLIWPIHVNGDLAGPLLPDHLQREECNETINPKAPNKGWLCIKTKLAARGTTTFHCGLSWFFPNHLTTKGTRVGHMYENWFDDSRAVASYMAKGHDKLAVASTRLSELVLASPDLPPSLACALLDQLNTLTKCTHFAKDGRIGLQEGLGCCAFNTVDVDHYSSYGLATLHPELRATIMAMQTKLAHPDIGKIHHGLPGTIEDIPAGGGATDGYSRWDVCCQYTLQLYRDSKWAGDRATLEAGYPTAKRAMELIASLDFYGIGLPFIQGGITYDHWNMMGVVTYMAGVYLAGLRALEDMATILGDDATRAWAVERFQQGRQGFETHLHNGEQYLLYYGRRPKGWQPGDDSIGEHKILEPVKPPAECMPPAEQGDCGADCACHREPAYVEIGDTGMMTDLLNGNATAQVMGLGSFLNPKRVKKQLKQTYATNLQEENRCLVNGSYPDDHFLDQWPFMQWQTPWTGTEYFFALMCYCAGLVSEGDRIVEIVHQRHAEEGMRFDHAECNNHYARPLCIWGAYAARCGIDLDGFRKALTIAPPAGGYRGALVTAQCLGSVDLQVGKNNSCTITLVDGGLKLKQLQLKTKGTAKKVSVKLGGKKIAATLDAAKGLATIRFDKQLSLSAKAALQVRFA